MQHQGEEVSELRTQLHILENRKHNFQYTSVAHILFFSCLHSIFQREKGILQKLFSPGYRGVNLLSYDFQVCDCFSFLDCGGSGRVGLHESIKNMSNQLVKQNNRNRNLIGFNTDHLLKLNHISAPQVTGSSISATLQMMVFRWAAILPPSTGLFWRMLLACILHNCLI